MQRAGEVEETPVVCVQRAGEGEETPVVRLHDDILFIAGKPFRFSVEEGSGRPADGGSLNPQPDRA